MKKEEKKVLFFDQEQFDYALKGLAEIQKSVEYLIRAWQMQEILKNEPFSRKHLEGIIRGKNEYIEDAIFDIIKANWEKAGPGMSSQVTRDGIKVNTSYDAERLVRTVDGIQSWPAGFRSSFINWKMIDIEKEKPVIPEKTIELLRKKFTVCDDDDPKLKQIFEVGQIGEASLNTLQKILDDRHKQREQASGFKLPATGMIRMFQDKKQPGQDWGGLFYMDQSGKWSFNLKKMI